MDEIRATLIGTFETTIIINDEAGLECIRNLMDDGLSVEEALQSMTDEGDIYEFIETSEVCLSPKTISDAEVW